MVELKHDDDAVQIRGYSLIRRDRKSRSGGEVCAYIESQIPSKILTCFQDVRFETLWLYLRPHKLFRDFSCLVVCVVYHPPSSDNNALIEHLTTKLDVSFQIKFKLINLKRNSSGRTSIYEYTHPA